MRYVIEFTKRTFWGFGPLDQKAFNDQLRSIQADGVIIIAIAPHTTFLGYIAGYSLLVEDTKAH
ncbi:hypothetical protein [Rheinheimera sp.]|uniref:hypothetical protein n=1 Tax=Rheinheimera sp. TaxID=1869214 RepID=UPI003AF9A792